MFEEVLMGLSWETCQRVDSTVESSDGLFNAQNGQAFDGFVTLSKVESNGRCLVGCFKGEGKEGFMMVNVEDTSKQKCLTVTLTFQRPTVFAVYKNGQCATERFDGIVTLELGVGEGIFMIEE